MFNSWLLVYYSNNLGEVVSVDFWYVLLQCSIGRNMSRIFGAWDDIAYRHLRYGYDKVLLVIASCTLCNDDFDEIATIRGEICVHQGLTTWSLDRAYSVISELISVEIISDSTCYLDVIVSTMVGFMCTLWADWLYVR